MVPEYFFSIYCSDFYTFQKKVENVTKVMIARSVGPRRWLAYFPLASSSINENFCSGPPQPKWDALAAVLRIPGLLMAKRTSLL
jgi:hypothetical protein